MRCSPVLYEPINRPKPAADGVWIVDGPAIRFMGLPFPTRMTLVRLEDGALFVHSPIALDEGLKARIDALGRVAHLVAPNPIHYWWVGEWKAAYPRAVVWAAPGMDKRLARRGAAAERILEDRPPPDWAREIDQLLVRSAAMAEAVFFHRPSRTLILTDLIENFEPGRIPCAPLRALARLAGNLDPDGKAPIDMRLSFLGRRRAARAAVGRMIAWGPERVVLAHGRWYRENGTAELKRAFRWLGPLD